MANGAKKYILTSCNIRTNTVFGILKNHVTSDVETGRWPYVDLL